MVRGIVGALLDVGRGYRSIAGFRQLLDHPDRIGAVQTAPAQGLTLMRVEY
jgi:tRNA pseudouridine38-40 synthase